MKVRSTEEACQHLRCTQVCTGSCANGKINKQAFPPVPGETSRQAGVMVGHSFQLGQLINLCSDLFLLHYFYLIYLFWFF